MPHHPQPSPTASANAPAHQADSVLQSDPATATTEASGISATAPPPAVPPQRLPNWLRQSERFLRVVVRMYLGLLVCCAPWYAPAWDANPLFTSAPWLLAVATNGAVRGLVSGLGLLNLWIALRDALRHSSDPTQE